MKRSPSSRAVFFGYPSKPEMLRETLINAARVIETRLPEVTCRTWEQLRVTGRLIITPVLAEIDRASLSIFEVTEINQNVMFELGYAIGSEKPVWLLRDPTDAVANRRWNQMRTLTTIGYEPYRNSDHIWIAFNRERPDLTQSTIFAEEIEPILEPATAPGLFYMSGLHDTEAGRALSRRIHEEEMRHIKCVTADPTESAVLPLSWYAQQIYSARAVVVHFDSPRRIGADVHNARAALIAGLARGMARPLLMLAEDDYLAPIDYRDLLYVYKTAQLCVGYTDKWLTATLSTAYEELSRVLTAPGLKLSTELKSLRLGDHVAENEADVLSDYFVETPPFNEVLSRKTTVFVGRKGVGKSANFYRAGEVLREDRRQLVVEIKPYGYELESVVRLLKRYQARDAKGYVVESLWKFLLYSEIALAAAAEIGKTPAGVPRDPAEEALVDYLDNAEFLTQDFGVRLERAVERLATLEEDDDSVEGQREGISETLHGGVLRDLRRLLTEALKSKTRVAVLIDNLDKAWERSGDIEELAFFLLGLVNSVERMTNEFTPRAGRGSSGFDLTLAVFVRGDIFSHVIRAASEPDKIPTSRLEWADREVLLRVIEERYVASRDGMPPPEEVWEKYFCPSVRGMPTRYYLAERVLPRPRDIVYLCNAAIAAAVNRRHVRVEEDDVLDAEQIYSQFAFEAIQVEDVGDFGDLEEIMFGFAGSDPILSREGVTEILKSAGVEEEHLDGAVAHLRSLTFLGIEVRRDRFDFSSGARENQRADVLARRLGEKRGFPAYCQVHPAFRAYLEISEPTGEIEFSHAGDLDLSDPS